MVQDINWINERAPYKVTVENENLLSITTDTGKVIGAGFRRFFTIGSHMVIYFSFKILTGERGGRPDFKLGATASVIIKRCLIENPDNILFFCHGDTNMTWALQRIFMRWADLYVKEHPEDAGERLYMRGKDFNGDKWHAVFFISNQCSEREDLIQVLIEQKNNFIGTFVKNNTETKKQLRREFRQERKEKENQ